MNDLLSKLEAAIAETERIALAAILPAHGATGCWEFQPWINRVIEKRDGASREIVRHVWPCEGEHIVRNDPARVLRRVARDRKLLELHHELFRDIGWLEDGDERTEELPVCGHCVPKHSWFKTRAEVPVYPCADVRDLAEDYEIQMES